MVRTRRLATNHTLLECLPDTIENEDYHYRHPNTLTTSYSATEAAQPLMCHPEHRRDCVNIAKLSAMPCTTYKDDVYAVFEVSATATSDSNIPPNILRIVALWCSCEAGLGGQCVHGSSLLHAVMNHSC